MTDYTEVNLRKLTQNGDDCMMIAIKKGNFQLLKYLAKLTKRAFSQTQLDYNGGYGNYPPNSKHLLSDEDKNRMVDADMETTLGKHLA